MKKIMSIILIFVMMMSLAACGKSHNTQASGSENYHGEGQVQGGIKSDDEIAALQEEERAGTTDAQQSTTEDGTENNQQSGDSDATPATSGTGNFDDYWVSDDFFDIVSYLNDNGCVLINYTDSTGSTTEDESQAILYNAYFNGCSWEIRIIGSGCILTHLSADDNTGTPEYTTHTNGLQENNIRLSNNNNAVTSLEALQILDTIIHCIQENPNSLDPLNGTDIMYSQTK